MPYSSSRSRDLWLFFGCALLLLGAGLGLRDPWPADEPRFALVAKQMVESGEWLFPRRGIELYSDKPPAFMWLQAAAYSLVGNWRVAFLLPSLLAALGSLVLVYDLARRLWNHRIGLYGAAALLLTVQFTWLAKKAQIDTTVCFWIALSCYGLLRHLLLGPAWRWYAIGWFAAGLGIITKGVGVLALLLLIPYAYARWRGYRRLAPIDAGGWRWALGPLALIAALAVWIVPMLLAVWTSGDPSLKAYAGDILFRQTAGRYANPWHHVKPFWYFLPIMLWMWLPLSLNWPWSLPAWWRRGIVRRDARYFLPLAWSALVVVFFSLSPGKREVYILPALPMLALATAPLIPGLLRLRWLQIASWVLTLLLGAALLGGAAWALFGEPGFATRIESERGLGAAASGLWRMLAAIGSLALLAALTLRTRRGILALSGALVAFWLLFGWIGYPLLNDTSSAQGLMRQVEARIPVGDELAMAAWKEQNLLQARRPVATFGFLPAEQVQVQASIAWLRAAPERRWVMVNGSALEPCVDAQKAHALGKSNRREWWLFQADAIKSGCVAP